MVLTASDLETNAANESILRRMTGLAFTLVLHVLTVGLSAQCSEDLMPRAPVPGTNRWVNAMTWWDPDGGGPRSPVVVIAGKFWTAGNRYASKVATWDPQSGEWASLGEGIAESFNGPSALAVLHTGELVVGGDFAAAGSGAPLSYLARWDGTSWQSLGGGTNGPVSALLVRANGDLVVGGAFTATGGLSNYCIGVWSGGSWHSLPTSLNGPVTALAEMPNGDLVAGGAFSLPGAHVARHNGSSWLPMGFGFTSANGVAALAVMPNGSLVAAGSLFASGTTQLNNLARYTGSGWVALAPGSPQMGPFKALRVLSNGDLLVGGSQSSVAYGVTVGSWNGTNWTTYGSPPSYDDVRCLLELPGGDILAGGDFKIVSGRSIWNVRRWDGTAWQPLIAGSDGGFTSLVQLPNGNLVAGGTFQQMEGHVSPFLSTWDGVTWRPLGGSPSREVSRLAVHPDGRLVAAGYFTSIGGAPATLIARWDGVAWDSLGQPFDPLWEDHTKALLACANGDIYVGGDLHMAGGGPPYGLIRWNGSTWSGFGLTALQAVTALAELPNGDVIAAGPASIGGVPLTGLGRFDGSAWHPFGQGLVGAVDRIVVAPNGNIIVGGWFTINGGASPIRLAWSDGTVWHAMSGTGEPIEVRSIEALPNGDILVGATYPWTPFPRDGVCRWDGSSWSWVARFGGGASSYPIEVQRMANGSVQIGGSFDSVNEHFASANLIEWRPTCPAQATDVGGGCPGHVQSLVLRGDTLPWLASSFAATATGFGTGALAASVFGVTSPATSLQVLTPLAGPACALMASTESITLVPVMGGEAHASLAIPNASAYVGIDLYHQFVQLEPGGVALGPRVSTSNGLRLHLGAY